MNRVAEAARSWPVLILFVCIHVAAADSDAREKWMVGRWICQIEGRPDRSLAFHADHSWGVEKYVPSSSDEGSGTIREDVSGRRWHIRDNKLFLRAPSDYGFQTYGEKIVSFRHDEIVTDIATYTREKLSVRKQNELLQRRNKLPPYDQDSEKRYYGPQSKP
jgi:hypothetical protein